jgi:hypothetical protein
MKKSVHLASLLLCGALAISGAAQAATTWYLKDVTFSNGAGGAVDQASGWFTYDEVSNTYTDWNISVVTVSGQNSSWTFDSASLTNKITWGDDTVGVFRGEAPNVAFITSLSFAESLTTATGDVAIKSSNTWISRSFRQYSITTSLVSGSITTSPVPELETGVAFAMGLLGLMAVARRRPGHR